MFIPGRKYRWTDTSGSRWIHGGIYTATSEFSIETAIGGPYSSRTSTLRDYFELVEEQKEVQKERKEKQEYRFKVTSPKAINLGEIYQGLTRENPIAIVKRSDGMHTVLVHISLEDKLACVDEAVANRFETAMEPYDAATWLPIDSGTLTPLLQAARSLRNASYISPWKGEVECQVELLKI